MAWFHSERLLEQMSWPMPLYFSMVSALCKVFVYFMMFNRNTMGHLPTDLATLYTFYFQERGSGLPIVYWFFSCPPQFPIRHFSGDVRRATQQFTFRSGGFDGPQMSRVTKRWRWRWGPTKKPRIFVEIHSDPIYVDMW